MTWILEDESLFLTDASEAFKNFLLWQLKQHKNIKNKEWKYQLYQIKMVKKKLLKEKKWKNHNWTQFKCYHVLDDTSIFPRVLEKNRPLTIDFQV